MRLRWSKWRRIECRNNRLQARVKFPQTWKKISVVKSCTNKTSFPLWIWQKETEIFLLEAIKRDSHPSHQRDRLQSKAPRNSPTFYPRKSKVSKCLKVCQISTATMLSLEYSAQVARFSFLGRRRPLKTNLSECMIHRANKQMKSKKDDKRL